MSDRQQPAATVPSLELCQYFKNFKISFSRKLLYLPGYNNKNGLYFLAKADWHLNQLVLLMEFWKWNQEKEVSLLSWGSTWEPLTAAFCQAIGEQKKPVSSDGKIWNISTYRSRGGGGGAVKRGSWNCFVLSSSLCTCILFFGAPWPKQISSEWNLPPHTSLSWVSVICNPETQTGGKVSFYLPHLRFHCSCSATRPLLSRALWSLVGRGHSIQCGSQNQRWY